MLAVEDDEVPDQLPVGRVGFRFDREAGRADEFGKFVAAQRDLADHAVRAASAALQRPEQVGVRTGIRKTNLAVSSDDLGLQQAAGSGSIVLREASEAAALNQAGHADRQASAALNVLPPISGHRIVGLPPKDPGTQRDSRLGRHGAFAAPWNERVMHRDFVHAPRPDQQ